MGLFRAVFNRIQMELVCADPAKAMHVIQNAGLTLADVEFIDDLSFRFTVSGHGCRNLTALARRKGWQVRLLQRQGFFWKLQRLQNRPVLIIGVLLLLFLSLLLPGRILFVQVEGNSAVPTNRILEAAAKQGVCLGASGRELRSEQIKNAMLEEITQLQWLGVNTKGCVAVISVRERQQKPADELLPPVTHMIAKADGIVQSVTVTRGTALCKPGDAVTAGQKLISGYTDLGICIQGTQAKGEVYALTQRKITAISPSVYDLRGEQRGQTVKFALLIGKKRINFYKCSGILDTRCARIYSVWYMTLPGGFQLPLGIIKEVWLDYEASPGKPEIFDLSDAASRYLLDALADGQILASQTALREDDSAYILNGSYVCREMIAQIQIEENG